MRIYMDVCCLNRPFDDQSQERIKLESEAVLMILHRCEICEWVLVGSEVIELEISRIADPSRRTKVEMVYSIAKVRVRIDDDIRNRALEIKNMGFSNAVSQRTKGLTGKNKFQAFEQAYEQFKTADGLYPASWEVIYGHAWVGEGLKLQNHENFIPIKEIR